MWKDYLHFTRSEQRGIIFLIILIFLGLLTYAFMPRFIKVESHDFTLLKAQVDSFYAQAERDSLQRIEDNKTLAPITFSLDTVSELWLIKHGMPKYTAKNLCNYRNKGGKITDAEKFRSIYGMNDSIFEAWKPFVVYMRTKKKATKQQTFTKEESAYKPKTPEFQIDINTADTAELVVIYGIGPSFADRIVKYRKALGGYYSIQQIREVYGMDSAKFESIHPYLKSSKIELKKLPINTASLKRMKYHPYFNFYQAKAVYEYRKAGNTIENWQEFITIEGLDTTGMKYLKHYLDYEIPIK